MKAAVLCNGPSRTSYISRDGYEFVIGCNVPWTDVDATVVIDEEMIEVWSKKLDLITTPVYFSEKAWIRANTINKNPIFAPFFAGLIQVERPYHSSGHNAAEIAIKKGATVIDVYGCDSWFEKSAMSYTRKYVPAGPNEEIRQVSKVNGWRERWKSLIKNNQHVQINFIQ